jgi:hypothetical protein
MDYSLTDLWSLVVEIVDGSSQKKIVDGGL